jgi:glutathione S-transferase
MATIKIYGVPPSTFTRTACLAAHEKGIDFELVAMRPGDLGALNPFRKIPVLQHGDLTLYETTAILRYLDRAFPGPRLWPEDSRGAALCDQWTSAVCDSLANSALRYIAARFGFLPVPAEMQDKYLDKTREVVPVFEARLGESRHLAGPSMTAADLFAFPLLAYFPVVPELAAILATSPYCRRWLAEISARPSAQATAPEMPRQAA